MKKIFILLMLIYLMFDISCKKTKDLISDNSFYLSFEHDNIVYNLNVDSLIFVTQLYYNNGNNITSLIDIHKAINGGGDLDSARRGLIKLAALELSLKNSSQRDTGLLGTFTTDTSINNYRLIQPQVTHVTIFTQNDPKKGIWQANPNFPFTITINSLTKTYIAGIFNGMLNNRSDTLTITNGKFKIRL